jgi:hypothetical protein
LSFDLNNRKEPLEQIAVAPDEITANIWKDVLAQNGIQCLLQSRHLEAAIYLSALKMDFGILVLKSQSIRAREILQTFQQEDPFNNTEGNE